MVESKLFLKVLLFVYTEYCSSASVRETVILNVTGTSSLSILNALNVSLFYRMIHRNLNI